jgi:NitT/TauT family transport system substrate-binding protein
MITPSTRRTRISHMPPEPPSPFPPPGRRDALRRLGLAGLASATLAGTGALWARALTDNGGAPPGDGMTPISHQLGWLKGVQFGGDFIADDKGYFRDEKLAVTFTAGGPGTDYRTIVASGRALVSESNVMGMISSAIQGQPLIAFAAILQRDPSCIASSPDRPIATVRDLVGKTVGVPASIRGQLSELMRRAGLDPDTVRFVPSGTDPGMLVAGQVDGYYDWATKVVPDLRRIGFNPHIMHMSDIGAPGYGAVLFTRRDRLEHEFDTFVRYTRALVKGWRWMVDNPAETARIVNAQYAAAGGDLAEQTDEATMMTGYVAYGDGLTKGLLWIAPDYFEQTLKLAYDAGSVPRGTKVDVGQFVTDRVIKAASAGI